MLFRFFIFHEIFKIGHFQADLGMILKDLEGMMVSEDYIFNYGKNNNLIRITRNSFRFDSYHFLWKGRKSLSILDYTGFLAGLSQIQHDVGTNEADECNGTSVLNEIILNHADEIEKNSLKTQSKISNGTDSSMNTTFSMQHSKHCFEKFKVYICNSKYFR